MALFGVSGGKLNLSSKDNLYRFQNCLVIWHSHNKCIEFSSIGLPKQQSDKPTFPNLDTFCEDTKFCLVLTLKISSLPRWAGSLLLWTNYIFIYKSFLRKVRSHLGKPTRLNGPAHLHINSSLVYLHNNLRTFN